MALTPMPMRAAVFLSWDTARMALPTLVAPHQVVEGHQHGHGGQDDHHRLDLDVDDLGADAEQGDAVVEVAEGGDHPVELAGGEAFDQADDVLEGERHADGGDERDQSGGIAQGPVGDALHQHGHAAGGGHADQQGQAQVAEGADGPRPWPGCRAPLRAMSDSTPQKAPMAKISLWAKLMNWRMP